MPACNTLAIIALKLGGCCIRYMMLFNSAADIRWLPKHQQLDWYSRRNVGAQPTLLHRGATATAVRSSLEAAGRSEVRVKQ